MELSDMLYTDPRFLEVVRMLRGCKRETKKTSPPTPEEPEPDDEVTRRVQAKINLRMKQRKTKQR